MVETMKKDKEQIFYTHVDAVMYIADWLPTSVVIGNPPYEV